MFPDYPFLMTMLRATSFSMRVEKKKIILRVLVFVNQLHLSILLVLFFVNCLFFEKMIDVFIFLKLKTF